MACARIVILVGEKNIHLFALERRKCYSQINRVKHFKTSFLHGTIL